MVGTFRGKSKAGRQMQGPLRACLADARRQGRQLSEPCRSGSLGRRLERQLSARAYLPANRAISCPLPHSCGDRIAEAAARVQQPGPDSTSDPADRTGHP
jgi:hypothetical protein